VTLVRFLGAHWSSPAAYLALIGSEAFAANYPAAKKRLVRPVGRHRPSYYIIASKFNGGISYSQLTECSPTVKGVYDSAVPYEIVLDIPHCENLT